MVLYMSSNTIPDISFAVHQCDMFTHNIKASHDAAVKRIFHYIQGTKYNCMVFNPSNKLVMGCYGDADFAGLWEHKKYSITYFSRGKTVFVVIFSYCHLLWVSKIRTYIAFYTLNYDYVALS